MRGPAEARGNSGAPFRPLHQREEKRTKLVGQSSEAEVLKVAREPRGAHRETQAFLRGFTDPMPGPADPARPTCVDPTPNYHCDVVEI
ncbi:hypothetical protein NDU88_002787 [Pleurodeles waltl]|uniref:Uncharacterized protein n=1 Tax=Pleurodeles waltl TaxID=8319 RepID=A0AAV7UE59_PLEWA|nr:hypothetical protein NDU88_002787 [Pleurodeles waltl]